MKSLSDLIKHRASELNSGARKPLSVWSDNLQLIGSLTEIADVLAQWEQGQIEQTADDFRHSVNNTNLKIWTPAMQKFSENMLADKQKTVDFLKRAGILNQQGELAAEYTDSDSASPESSK